jgi:hypothetical protein
MTDADYHATVAAVMRDPKARTVAVCNLGGDTVDGIRLAEFVETLRPDLNAQDHRQATRAFLATFNLPKDADRERGDLQEFIWRACREMGWTVERTK